MILAVVAAAVVNGAGRPSRVPDTGLLLSSDAGEGPREEVGGPAPTRRAPARANAGGKQDRCLDTSRLERARQFADRRSGSVAFAFLDECGRLVGEHRYRVYASASVIKVMLLVAYLRQPGLAERELDVGERDLLGRMIEQSDNDAADGVFAIVGESGLDEVAEAAGMRRFESSPYWGGSGITAADQTSFLDRIEHYVPKLHEDYALELLGGVIESQRWGIPQAEPKHWSVHFKGGWYPVEGSGWRVNQVATLRNGPRSLALAVLSDGDPSFGYGQETIEGVARRLLGGYPH